MALGNEGQEFLLEHFLLLCIGKSFSAWLLCVPKTSHLGDCTIVTYSYAAVSLLAAESRLELSLPLVALDL